MSSEERRRDYETMIVLRSDLPEAGVKEQIERFTSLLQGHGAAVRGVHEWGMRELAYPVQKERRGFYLLIEYTGGVAALDELERQLKLSDLVLRCVSVRQQFPVPVASTPQGDSDDDPGDDRESVRESAAEREPGVGDVES